MPLEAAAPTLELDLDAAYQTSKEDGSADGCEPDAVIAQKANDVATAIHDYMLQALVSTDVEVDSGQPDVGGGSTSNSPPTGTGVGSLS